MARSQTATVSPSQRQDSLRVAPVSVAAVGGTDAVREYCTKLISTPQGALSFLQKFLTQSRSQSMGDYVSRIRWSVRLSNIEAFVPIDDLKARLAQLPKTAKRSDLEQNALVALEKGPQA